MRKKVGLMELGAWKEAQEKALKKRLKFSQHLEGAGLFCGNRTRGSWTGWIPRIRARWEGIK